MKSKLVPMHKRLAMDDGRTCYARGGRVGSNKVNVAVRAPVGATPDPVPNHLTANPMSPAERAKRNNGVRGMKKGGKC